MNNKFSPQIYTYTEQDGQYQILKHDQPLMTSLGKAVVAGYKALADALVNDLHEFGEGHLAPDSIVAFHYTMLDLIWDFSTEKLRAPLIKAIESRQNRTMDIRYNDIETMGIYYTLYGVCDSKRIAKIKVWIMVLTRTQLCAVLVARDCLGVNLLYNLAECVASSELETYKEYYHKLEGWARGSFARVIDNFLLYYLNDVFGNTMQNLGDSVAGKRSYSPSTYNETELLARLSFDPLQISELTEFETAICIAARAHHNQFEKTGKPYILHPLRLMTQLSDEHEMTVAVLHDVVEDSELSFEDLIAVGISHQAIASLKLLTHVDGVPYQDYIAALARDPVARRIKMLDLQDNMDLNRMPNPRQKDFDRIQRYHEAYKYLEGLI